MTITLLHTAETHRTSFDALRDRIAPGVPLLHRVRPDFLSRAQAGGDDALDAEIIAEVSRAPGPVLCTCTTIGPVAARAGALRIDGPMMQAAAGQGGPVMLAYCLESTRAPSLALLEDARANSGNASPVHLLPLTRLWPLFTAGAQDDFHRAITEEVRRALAQAPEVRTVVLAQASMAGAALLLDDLGLPVLASPDSALRAALARL